MVYKNPAKIPTLGVILTPKGKIHLLGCPKILPKFFQFFYIFEKLMNWALIFGFGFEPYLDYYWP